MVLESLIFPVKAENKPWELFFLGLLYASVGILLSLWIFRSEASMIMVLLTVIAVIPLVYRTFKREEKKDTIVRGERNLLREHGKALKFLMYLFFGFIVAYALWFVFLPQDTSFSLFRVQLNTINQINSNVAGNAISNGILFRIFFNNLKVLFFAMLFAFFYGAGAIFILTWNASVIGAAIGEFSRDKISTLGSYAFSIPFAIGRYMTHGVFEILAYFVGGLAGGIISVAIINHDINSDKFKIIMKDSLDLILISVALLIVAAFVEVFVTPIIFS
ncbi:MAG: stage II sporulation protein M [Nanoarchaeota archaeon]